MLSCIVKDKLGLITLSFLGKDVCDLVLCDWFLGPSFINQRIGFEHARRFNVPEHQILLFA